jgi:uroporphyrin-3 C-methyltransferase
VNTEKSEIEDEIAAIPGAAQKPRRTGSALIFLAFIFSLAALAGTAWIWWQDEMAAEQDGNRVVADMARLENAGKELSDELAQVQGKLESLDKNDNNAQIADLKKRFESDAAQLAGLNQIIREQQALAHSLQADTAAIIGRLRSAETTLADMSLQDRDAESELDLAAADYLLRLANERLKLFSDPVTADQALAFADLQLAAVDNPGHLNARRAIAAARSDLAKVTLPDYLSITSQLDAVQASIVSLPFPGEAPVSQESETETQQGRWEKVKNVFSNLVTVRRSTEQENERISLEDMNYIRQRLWLQLEIAHLSLMRREQAAFRLSLERAGETLSTWFDSRDSVYQSVIGGIDQLLATEIEVEMPDISTPLGAIRQLRENRSRLAPAPGMIAPAEPAEPVPENQPVAEGQE